LMLWAAPPLAREFMEVGTIILLEICAAHESLRGTSLPFTLATEIVAFGVKQTFSSARNL
jgi:hypothetical protein